MTSFMDFVLFASEALIVILGSLLVFVSLRAYRRVKDKPMLVMAAGFAIIIAGSLIEEVALEILGYHLMEAHTLENSVVAIGLLVLVYSIYGVRG